MNCANPATRRKGFTLVEVMIAIAIITAAALFTLLGLSGLLQSGKVAMTRVIAASALRSQAEEIMAVAEDTQSSDSFATSVLQYYASTFDRESEKLPLGPGGAMIPRVELVDGGSSLLYRFPVRHSGDAARTPEGEFDIDRNVIGTINFYLDETAVGAPEGAEEMWRDLGDGTGEQDHGFDMNQDGKILPRTEPMSMSLLKNNPAALGITQLPVDITVVFYANENHDAEFYSQTRRMVVTGSRSLSSLLVP